MCVRACRLRCRRVRAAEGAIGTASSVIRFATEQDWAKKLGVLTPEDAMLTDEGLKAHRDAYCNAIRDVAFPGQNGPQRGRCGT